MTKLGFTLEEIGAAVGITEKKYVSDFPELMLDWDTKKNILLGFDPAVITIGSSKPVAWQCHVCKQPFVTKPKDRWCYKEDTFTVRKCPVCSNQIIVQGINDSLSTNPELGDDVHPDDKELLARLTAGNNTVKLRWVCQKCGELNVKTIYEHRRSSVCPKCGRKGCEKNFGKYYIGCIDGVNDLASQCPEIAAEWDTEKNDRLASEVALSSPYRAYWICPNGHHYDTTVYSRAVLHSGCPYCANKQALIGWNDLYSLFPDIANEWDKVQNEKTPKAYVYGSGYKAHWICSKCHGKYVSTIADRTVGGHGCPYCAHQLLGVGINDLQHLFPDIAAEWHPTKNGNLKPTDVLGGGSKKVWWLCPNCGRDYETRICNRTNRHSGCPYCMKSHGEKALYKAAQLCGNENFIAEKPIRTSRYKETGSYQRLDGFLPDTALGCPVVFEFMGAQHFMEVKYFASGSLKDIQERDYAKYIACKKLGYQIIYVTLNDFDTSNFPYRCIQVSEKHLVDKFCEILSVINSNDWKTFSQYAA